MLGAGEKAAASWSHMGIYDDNHHLVPEAEPYTSSSTLRKLNHPLMIMVEEARVVSLLLLPAATCRPSMQQTTYSLEPIGPSIMHGFGET